MALPSCTQPLAPCLEALFEADNDLLLENVQDSDGAALPGGTVDVDIFDVDDLTTALLGPISLSDDGGGDYSGNFKAGTADGFFVGQRIKIVYTFDGPGADDDRLFNVIAIVCEG